eukprot:sb/3478895/
MEFHSVRVSPNLVGNGVLLVLTSNPNPDPNPNLTNCWNLTNLMNLSLYSLCVSARARACQMYCLCILSVGSTTDYSLQREYRERFITLLHYLLEFYY